MTHNPDDSDVPSSTFCANFSCSAGQLITMPKNEGQQGQNCFCDGNGHCCDQNGQSCD